MCRALSLPDVIKPPSAHKTSRRCDLCVPPCSVGKIFLCLHLGGAGCQILHRDWQGHSPHLDNRLLLGKKLASCSRGFMIAELSTVIVLWFLGFHIKRNPFAVYILNLASLDQVGKTIGSYLIQNPRYVRRSGNVQEDMIRFISLCLFLLAALSVDRCLLALLPLWYRCHRPLRLSCYLCLGAWLVAALLTIKDFVFADIVLYPDRMLVCSSDRGKYEWPLHLLEVLLEGLFPFVIMVITHVATFKFYHIVAATLSAYVLLNLPFHIVQLLFLVSWEHKEFNNHISSFMVYFGYLINLNSSINPLIYIFFGSNICTGCGHHMTSSLAMALTEEQERSPRDMSSKSFSA
uniref:G-protein coupled receptors family 1 profile domain-containing protein n=1 Tax=Gopherus evgoodei TaxID=1825980 RepID=A0A8C4WSJ3_9SAUR